MNRKPSPKIIGVFVSAALVLFVGMIVFFGTATFLSQSVQFILFFDQSVNGLQVGSPVKFRGVPVGSVERIMIRVDGQREDSTAIPVIIKVNHSRLRKDLGVSESDFQPETIQQSIDRGLVAELNLESFITGQFFVEFSFKPEETLKWQRHATELDGIVEIPTLTSSLDQITGDLAQLISDFGAVDLPRLNENVNTVLENLAVVLEGIDSEGISHSVTTAADQVSALVSSEDFVKSVEAMRTAFEAISVTASSLNLKEGPLADIVKKWTDQLSHTLSGLDQLVAEGGELLKPSSNLRYEFENTLRELSRAAQSMRLLTDYLERNPSALLTGRPEDSE